MMESVCGKWEEGFTFRIPSFIDFGKGMRILEQPHNEIDQGAQEEQQEEKTGIYS